MSDTVSWVLTLSIEEDQFENFTALMEEMVAHTKNEPGTLAYEWFVSEDKRSVHIYERYQDSEAAAIHNAGFGKNFAARFMSASKATGFYVYGEPSDAVREQLGAAGAQFLGTLGGFSR